MSKTIKMYEIPPSPNNLKVRIGLGYKGLDYERHVLDLDEYPGDRSQVVKVSRQPLTPTLQHGDTVIFDSGAILRYLEANFPDTPPLFSEDFRGMKEIEEWEWYGRTRLTEPVGMTFGQAFAAMEGKHDPSVTQAAAELMHELTGRVEDRLTTSPFLAGDHLTAADLTLVAPISTAMLPEGSDSPVIRFFQENMTLGAGRDRTREWAQRVLSHDKHAGL